MQFILDDKQMPKWAFRRDYPKEFITGAGITDHIYRDNKAKNRVAFRDVYFQGARLFYHRRNMQQHISFDTTIGYSYYQLFFWIKGCGGNQPSGSGKSFFANEQQHYINYSPSFEGKYYLNRSNKEIELLQIHLTENFFKRLVSEDNKYLYELAESGSQKKACRLANSAMVITPQMALILKKIIDFPQGCSYKRLFMESSILELLQHQLNQLDSLSKKYNGLANVDIEKLYHSKFILEQSFLNPPSISELAKMVCLNSFKLKTGFKSLFKTTPFEYVNNIRLEHGKHLIQSSQKSIAEAAYELGYSFPHHFSNAFKKKFGYLPKALKKATTYH